MMILEFVFALTIAFILTILFALIIPREGRRRGLFWFFWVIFLGTWAGGIWIRPVGPSLWGIKWLPFLLAGLLLTLLLGGHVTPRPPQNRRETLNMLERIAQEKKLDEITYVSLNLFFWVMVFIFIAVIITRYVMKSGYG
jgi:hypothetical protein